MRTSLSLLVLTQRRGQVFFDDVHNQLGVTVVHLGPLSVQCLRPNTYFRSVAVLFLAMDSKGWSTRRTYFIYGLHEADRVIGQFLQLLQILLV